MTRALIRRIALCTLAALPLQYAVAGIMGALGHEPWPALVLPGFSRVWEQGEPIDMKRPTLRVQFADGSAATVDAGALFEGVPRSHHPALLSRQFAPRSVSGDSATERGASPEVERWARRRLHALYPARRPTRLDVVWKELRFDPAGDRKMGPSEVVLDTLTLDVR